MSLQTQALSDAKSLYNKQLGALSSMRTQAGNMSRTASSLFSTGGGLLGQYDSAFAPLVNSLPEQANMPLSDYTNAAANDVGSNFDRSRGIMGREMARRGVNINSGRFAGLLADLSRNEAATRAGAMTNARITGQRENFGRGLQASQLGLSLANMGIGAQQGAGGLYGAAGGLYGQAAGQYGMASNQAGQYAGQQSMADQLKALLGGQQAAPAAGATPAQAASTPTTAGAQAPYYLDARTSGYTPAAAPVLQLLQQTAPQFNGQGLMAANPLQDQLTQFNWYNR